jgi:hypothetical protein
MAVVRTTIGDRTAEDVNISSVAGPVAGVYTVTLAAPPTADTVIGDKLTDEHAVPRSYLIVNISGSDLEVKGVFGETTAPDASGTSPATTVRAYASVTAANADLDSDVIYDAGDTAELAVCEQLTFYNIQQNISLGGTLGLSAIHLFGHANYRHDGTLTGTPAGLIETFGLGVGTAITTSVPVVVSWLILAKLPTSGSYNQNPIIKTLTGMTSLTVHHCLIYSNRYAAANGGSPHGIWHAISGGVVHVSNCQFWDIGNPTTGTGQATFLGFATASGSTAKNNTIYNCVDTGITALTTGHVLRNNISMGCGVKDFSDSISWGGTSSNNYASDTTAPGGSSRQSQVVADTFVDAAAGDLHIKSTANARTAGANLTGEGDDIETDIDGDSRPASPTAWDMGADWYVAAAISGIPCVAAPASGSFEF